MPTEDRAEECGSGNPKRKGTRNGYNTGQRKFENPLCNARPCVDKRQLAHSEPLLEYLAQGSSRYDYGIK